MLSSDDQSLFDSLGVFCAIEINLRQLVDSVMIKMYRGEWEHSGNRDLQMAVQQTRSKKKSTNRNNSDSL